MVCSNARAVGLPAETTSARHTPQRSAIQDTNAHTHTRCCAVRMIEQQNPVFGAPGKATTAHGKALCIGTSQDLLIHNERGQSEDEVVLSQLHLLLKQQVLAAGLLCTRSTVVRHSRIQHCKRHHNIHMNTAMLRASGSRQHVCLQQNHNSSHGTVSHSRTVNGHNHSSRAHTTCTLEHHMPASNKQQTYAGTATSHALC